MVENAPGATGSSARSMHPPRSRVAILVMIAVAASVPAVVLRVFCAGRACDASAPSAAEAPFCSLPPGLRRGLIEGFYEGRSPDVLAVAVTAIAGTTGSDASGAALWPIIDFSPDEVPIIFWGAGVTARTEIGPGAGLDDIAPTIAEIVGLARPHPEVRSGTAIPGIASGPPPRLVLEIALEGVDAAEIGEHRGWGYLRSLMRRGAGTMSGETLSQPADPAARLATIGTGGSPRQHGISGSLVRNEAGQVTPAWGPDAPGSVIAALGDDLDHVYRGRSRVGLVARDRRARGLIGGGWYIGSDRDDIVIGPREPVRSLAKLLRSGYGADDTPDLVGLTLEGPPRTLNRDLRGAVEAATSVAPGSVTVVVTSSGADLPADAAPVEADEVVAGIERAVPGGPGVVEGAVPGGLFLDQELLAARSISDDRVVRALETLGEPGRPYFADQFPATAVTFGRYC